MRQSFLYKPLVRARDLFVAFFGLLLLSPLFILVAIKIKQDSEGPVFFRGLRAGKHGKDFYILKFRTMYENPECYDGPKITGENDPRITKIGQWLRDTKINELPQLWNVLVGEMSLVGPRPEDPDIAMAWPEEMQQEILSIPPGITSPASVLYRDEEIMLQHESLMDTYISKIQPNKLRLDQLYVRYRSLWVDIDVLLWTFLVLFPGLSSYKPNERYLYGGVVARVVNVFTRWLAIDFFVALIGVSVNVVFWRTFGVISITFTHGLIVAIEFAIVFTVIGALFGVQRIQWSKASPADVLDLAFSSLGAIVIIMIGTRYLYDISYQLIISGGMTTFLGLVVVRYRYRLITGMASRWLRFRRGGDIFRERILIIGSGDAGSYAAWMLSNSQETAKFYVVGYLDDDYNKQGLRYHGVRVLGSTQDIQKVVKEYDVGTILFAIHRISQKKQEKLLKECAATKAQVIVFPNIIAHLSEAMEKNVYSNGKDEYVTQIEVPTLNGNHNGSNGNHNGKNETVSDPPTMTMAEVLGQLKTHWENANFDQCDQKITLLQDMINSQKRENIYE